MNPVRNRTRTDTGGHLGNTAHASAISNGMKIVIATPLYPPEIGGPATYAKLLIEGLPAKGIEIELVKFSEVRHLPKIIRHYAYYRRVLKAARHADVVLALDPVSVGLPAMCAAKKARKPFVVKIVGDYAWEQGVQRFGVMQNLDVFVKTKQKNFFVRVLQKVQALVVSAAKYVIVPSPYLKDIILEWGIPEEKIRIIYNGIGLPPDVETQPKKEGEFLVVSAGREVPWKGFDAIRRVVEKHKHESWSVHIASGLPRAEALGWMKTADVFVLNSSYEGFPHALIEAMTLGTPVVATDAKFHRALLEHGKTGILIPIGDDSALERALLEIRNNPDAASERALAAQKRMDDFSLPRMLESTAYFLKQIV
ncbi:MAG: glycosyltransferase family 4 protein [Candidatus Kaiserbacteria bacterium]|nr:glycosyltransferase family 4 protein [Candidatus Kaiserbacteria bacterium]